MTPPVRVRPVFWRPLTDAEIADVVLRLGVPPSSHDDAIRQLRAYLVEDIDDEGEALRDAAGPLTGTRR